MEPRPTPHPRPAQSRADYLRWHLRPPGASIAAGAQLRHARRRLAGERRAALVGPDAVRLPESLWKVLKVLGLRPVSTPRRDVALAVHWSLATVSPPPMRPGMVNGGCLDIGKHRLEAAARAALGYGLAVDPTVACGPCVVKSDENARHDGRVVMTPVASPVPGAVYQRLVDTADARGMLEELRVVVVAGAVPAVYLKRRPAADRFGHGAATAVLVRPDDVLDPPELAGVLRVCAHMGLDLGELDVLRDRRDGRVHVVDVNRTPWGPPRALGRRAAMAAVRRQAEAVARAWL
jgi:hypothetical protein